MKTTSWSLRSELPVLLVLAAMFAAAAWSWPRLPERIPTHWNLAGEIGDSERVPPVGTSPADDEA